MEPTNKSVQVPSSVWVDNIGRLFEWVDETQTYRLVQIPNPQEGN